MSLLTSAARRKSKCETIWKTSITTAPEAEEAVAELLATQVGPMPSTYTDAETGVMTVSAYATTKPRNIADTKSALRRRLAEIKTCGLDIGSARVSILKLPRENWANSWKRHFPPLEIGARLLVKPSWSKRKPRPGQSLVVLDPGLSFGTGQHATTGFCLREVVRAWERRQGADKLPLRGSRNSPTGSRRSGTARSFLDIGTGSGILALAAVKLGYAPVHAFDFDPQCVRVARANARFNRVQSRLRITRADLTTLPLHSSRRYDLVCANLLANLLIAERDRICARVKPKGILVIAGILQREFAEVQKVYEAGGWRLSASKTEKEWRSGTFLRRVD
jgi:ribosomal protein L11 methyltransferase